jgi:hypothetical protein
MSKIPPQGLYTAPYIFMLIAVHGRKDKTFRAFNKTGLTLLFSGRWPHSLLVNFKAAFSRQFMLYHGLGVM